MKNIFLSLILPLLIGYEANCQELLWAKRFGSTGQDRGYNTCVDNLGNVYAIGGFANTVDFDPGPGVFNLTSSIQNAQNVYITKLDNAGNFIWAKKIGDVGGAVANSFTLDPDGNLYLKVFLSGTVDVDPGAEIFNLTYNLNYCAILKIDPSGNLIWARQFNNLSQETTWGNTLKLDASGNVYSTGSFLGSVDFDPGAGVFLLSNIPNPSIYSGYILKLNPSGNFVWAKQFSNTNLSVQTSSTSAFAYSSESIFPLDLSFDAVGNVYSVGYFADTIDFDPGPGVFYLYSLNTGAGYISKLSPDGNFLWAKQFRNPLNCTNCIYGYGSSRIIAISLDDSGNIFTTGDFKGSIDFDPGSTVYNLESAGYNNDIFICKLDPSGNFLWANKFGEASDYDRGRSIAISDNGNYYLSGDFKGDVDFDSGLGVSTLSSGPTTNTFIAQYDNSGNIIWARTIGGSGVVYMNSIKLNTSNEIFMTGQFEGTIDFNPGPGVFNLVPAGNFDAFILKLNNCPTSYSSINVSACNSYTSPGGSASWTSSGVYVDSLQTNLGCDSIITINLTIYNSPSPTITTSGSTTLCQGGSVNLNAGSGYASYTWNTGAQTQTINAVTGNIYTVTVSNGNGCSGSDSQEVIVNSNPTPSIIPLGATTFCEGESVTLETDNAYVSYNWNTGGNSQAVIANSSNTYTVTVTDDNGCQGTASEIVHVNPNPLPLITTNGSTTICGEENLQLYGGDGFSTYLWTGGYETQNINVSNAGAYVLTVTNANGCIGNSAPIDISQTPIPSASYSYIENNNSIAFSDLTSGSPDTWAWDFGDGSSSSQQNPTHSYSTSGDYLVCLIASEGSCSDSICQIVSATVTGIDNIVTNKSSIYPNPNNGIFAIETFDVFSTEIYDMQGKILFSDTIYPGKNEIDLSNFSSGLYLLRAVNMNTSFQLKIEIIR